jgi:serine/threonine protein kinase
MEKSLKSKKIDIYAIGCLIYFSCTNITPFDEDEDIDELMK